MISKLNFPGLPTIPLLGSAPYLKRDPCELGEQIREFTCNNGFLCLVWLSYHPILLCGRTEYAEIVLRTSKHLTKSSMYSFLHDWLGTGLLTSGGDKWKKRRKALTPSFHFNILKYFSTIIEVESKVLVESLNRVCDSDNAVDIQPLISLATLDVICQTAMGIKINAQNQSFSEYVSAVVSMNSQLQLRQKSPWLWPDFVYRSTPYGKKWYKTLNTLHNFTTDVIRKRIQSRKEDPQSHHQRKQKPFLDALLELYDNGEIDIEGVREEVDTFMFEGHDTTASGISWTLYRLGRNQSIQKKLQKEIDEISNRPGDLIRNIQESRYLDCVVKEGLRMHPPVPLFARDLEEDVVVNGNLIPKGTTLGVAIAVLHYNPAYWDEPFTFNPDRFKSEKFINRHPYSYVPFSAGPRNCIGQRFAILEEKIMLYHVLLNFDLNSVQSVEEVRVCYEIIQKSENGLLVELKRRKLGVDLEHTTTS